MKKRRIVSLLLAAAILAAALTGCPINRKETAMLRILLVDDEPLVLIGLQGMLEWEKLGYTVCGTARNGKLALELIEREKPDIVIADVKMPVMDGLTLARTCRERNALPAFIMLTSFEEFDYIKQAMGAGVVDYLVKLDLTPENLQTALLWHNGDVKILMDPNTCPVAFSTMPHW